MTLVRLATLAARGRDLDVPVRTQRRTTAPDLADVVDRLPAVVEELRGLVS